MNPVSAACVIASVVSVVLEFVFVGGHGHAPFGIHVPGFHLVYGFIGCAAIVLVSKALGEMFLQKPEDFYSDELSSPGQIREGDH